MKLSNRLKAILRDAFVLMILAIAVYEFYSTEISFFATAFPWLVKNPFFTITMMEHHQGVLTVLFIISQMYFTTKLLGKFLGQVIDEEVGLITYLLQIMIIVVFTIVAPFVGALLCVSLNLPIIAVMLISYFTLTIIKSVRSVRTFIRSKQTGPSV